MGHCLTFPFHAAKSAQLHADQQVSGLYNAGCMIATLLHNNQQEDLRNRAWAARGGRLTAAWLSVARALLAVHFPPV